MRYKRRERETVILYNEAEENASVCTFNRKVTAGGECVTYTLPKTCVTIFPPHTEDWKDNMSKRAKSAEEE